MPFSLGLPLMDDNVKKNNLPLYFACMFFVKVLGPVIGLLVGSKLNEIYYTFEPLFCSSLLGLVPVPSDDLDEDEKTDMITAEKAELNAVK
ncbi:hypothetical protein OESDEN_09023 [Oesophagostomum dentatum]|uniref:Uncharacterized protein n=1 Tax=Oesophagostomum dentatum TaxID=61180 RepID=A0A0B1T1K9_OESDE|nr:hypothetical protein OESDEN_09023 [Oesophagostomum dentatum]